MLASERAQAGPTTNLHERATLSPETRRRGYGGAIVRRIGEEARRSDLDHLYLLAESGAEALSLYGRLGFEAIGHIARTLRPMG